MYQRVNIYKGQDQNCIVNQYVCKEHRICDFTVSSQKRTQEKSIIWKVPPLV